MSHADFEKRVITCLAKTGARLIAKGHNGRNKRTLHFAIHGREGRFTFGHTPHHNGSSLPKTLTRLRHTVARVSAGKCYLEISIRH